MTGDPRRRYEPPELLKTGEVAQLLGVVRSTVLSWAYRGLFDYTTTPGGQLRFYRDQIEAFVAAGHDAPATTRRAEERRSPAP